MAVHDGDATGLVLASNLMATRPTSTLVGRGLEMVEAGEPNEENFLKKCFEFLAEEGYRPKTNGHYIDFKKADATYRIRFHGDSKSVARISTLERYEKSDLNRFDALELANGINGIIDARVSVMEDFEDDYTWISFTSTCHYPDFFEESFDDRLNAIQEIIRNFEGGFIKWGLGNS